MGIQSFLAYRNANPGGVFRVVGATPVQVGGNIGTTLGTTAGTRLQNQVMKWNKPYIITGTVAVTNGSTTVTGTGTGFTSFYAAGSPIEFASQPGVVYTVATVGSTTSITLGGAYVGTSNTATQAIVKPVYLTIVGTSSTVVNVYYYDGVNWISPFAFSEGGTLNLTGMYPIYLNGVQTLVWGVHEGGTFADFHTSPDGITWTKVYGSNATSAAGSAFNTCVFRNQLFVSRLSGAIYVFDFGSNTYTAAGTVPDAATGTFCVYKDTLYYLSWITSGGSAGHFGVYAYSGGSWTLSCTLAVSGSNGAPSQDASGAQMAMWAPGDGNMYAIYENFNSTGPNWGWMCAQITGTGLSLTATDITSSVIPASAQYGTAPSISRTVQWRSCSETESTNNAVTTHLWVNTSSWSLFLWNGPATLIGNGGLPNDSGAVSSLILPNLTDGAGERIAYASDFNIRIIGTTAIATGLTVFFQIIGPVGNESKSASLSYDGFLQTPATQGTLSAPGVVATTIASGSNGVSLPTGTINVADTTGFPTSGIILVTTGAGTQTVRYTGIGLTSFTGCTGGTGSMSTGGNVLSGASAAPTLNVNNVQVDGATADGGTSVPTTYKMTWLSAAQGVPNNSLERITLRCF